MTRGHRTLLGFDYGRRRIGVAVAQELTGTASPLATVATMQSGKPDWGAIEKLVQTWRPDALVVGIPLNMDGTVQGMSRAAQRFANQLHERFRLPVHTADERLSSVEAKYRLRAAEGRSAEDRVDYRDQVNMVAAQLILQTWLTDPHNEPSLRATDDSADDRHQD